MAKAFRLSVVAYLDRKKIPERRVLAASEIGGIYMKDDAEQFASGPGADAAAEAVRKSLPNNWSLALTTASADFKPLRGLGNPLVQLTLTDDSRSLTWPLAPGKQKEFRPVLILLVFPASDKQRIDAAVLAERIRSDYPPLVFAVTKEHIFVTSPGYVNQGLHSAKAEAVIDELKDALKASMEIRYHTERPASAAPAGRGVVEP